MTHDEMIAVIAAHRDGKKIEFASFGSKIWDECNPRWNFLTYNYRVKPELRLRPWKPEEVPHGAAFKLKCGGKTIFFPTVLADALVEFGNHCVPYGYLMAEYLHSTDGGKTWLPCGVEE